MRDAVMLSICEDEQGATATSHLHDKPLYGTPQDWQPGY
jgi:hypothetical protein